VSFTSGAAPAEATEVTAVKAGTAPVEATEPSVTRGATQVPAVPGVRTYTSAPVPALDTDTVTVPPPTVLPLVITTGLTGRTGVPPGTGSAAVPTVGEIWPRGSKTAAG
jgi:hypothetical protein